MHGNETNFLVMAMIDTDKFAKRLGNKIAVCRKEQGLSQSQLGTLVNQSQQVIADYETGRRRIPACNLAQIADALGVPVSQLLERTNQTIHKRGPTSKLQQQFELVKRLPKTERQFVIRMLDNALAKAN